MLISAGSVTSNLIIMASGKKGKPVGRKPPKAPIKKAENKPLKSPGLKKENKTKSLVVLLFAFLAVIITYYCYSDSLKNGFTNWDDPAYVTESEIIDQGLTSENIKYIFTNPLVSNYHPLSIISLVIDYQSAIKNQKPGEKLDATPFHRTNLILHLLTTLMVFVFIYYLTKKKLSIAFIVALLFGIHPMHVESVAWIAERKDVLYGLFFVSGLFTYLKYLKTKRFLYFIITFLLFVLSLLSKPAAVIFPFTIFIIDFLMDDELEIKSFRDIGNAIRNYFRQKRFFRRATWEKLFLIAFAIAELIVTYKIQEQKAVADFDTFTIWQRFMFASYGFIMYLYKLVFPLNLSTFYPYPTLDENGYIPAIFYIAPFIVLAIVIGIYLSMRKTKVVLAGFAFYFITIVLVLQFVSVGRAIMSDRYSYIPYIGLFLMIGYLLHYLYHNGKKQLKLLAYGLALIISGWSVFLCFETYNQVKVWENSETLWTQTIKNYPFVDVAYKNRGNYYGKELNMPEKALKDYEVLVAMNTQEGEIYSNLGNIYGLLKQFDKSLDAYTKAIELSPDNLNSYINRGITYSMMQKYPEAFSDFDLALEKSPGSLKVFQNRAFAYLQNGDFEKSIDDYSKVINRYPNDPINYFYRGLAYFRAGNHQEALSDFTRNMNLDPKNQESVYNISVTYFLMKDYTKSLEFANKAKSMGFKVEDSFLAKIQNGLDGKI